MRELSNKGCKSCVEEILIFLFGFRKSQWIERLFRSLLINIKLHENDIFHMSIRENGFQRQEERLNRTITFSVIQI